MRYRPIVPGAALVFAALLAAAGCDEDSAVPDDALDGDSTADADAPPLAITTETLDGGRVQVPYSAQLEVANAAGSVTWTVSAGALPPGLALGPDGVIAGLPEHSGLYEFEITAADGVTADGAALSIAVPKVLLMSGFEPFGEFPVNSSWAALEPLDDMIVAGFDVRVVELAVVWGDSWDELAAEIDRLQPDIVIATGQAGPEGMRFETGAVNRMNGTDNNGVTMSGEPIVVGGRGRLTAYLPADEMRAAMEAGGFPALISTDAGDYLCNYVMYRLLDFCTFAADPPAAAGFIHVPPVPPTGPMTVPEITAAHRLGIEALAAWLASGKRARDVHPDIGTPPRYFFPAP
jgi:pyroglutamyl-peptidase